jgi:protein SMG6
MDRSSANSPVFDRPNKEHGNNAFAVQLKWLYRDISALETKILKEDAEESVNNTCIVIQGHRKEVTHEDTKIEKWNKLIGDHKRYVSSTL